jgi:hypothetical protein
MKFQYNDGGRTAARYQGKTGDCVCRSMAIITKMPYAYVFMLLNEHAVARGLAFMRQPSDGLWRCSAGTGHLRWLSDQVARSISGMACYQWAGMLCRCPSTWSRSLTA